MMLFDTIDVSSARLTKDGYLVAEPKVARTGIQLYRADELGFEGDPNNIIRVYRPPEEVFSTEAMASYAHRPVTVDHPSVMVDASNWKEFAKGQTGDDVVRDGEFVRVPMMLMDKNAINEWTDGKRELSMGYESTIEITDGTTPDGERFDAVQRNMRMNHLALVSRARGGSALRLGDTQPEDTSMDVKLTTITVDGLSVETTDAGAQAIAKLNDDIAKLNADAEAAQSAHDEALAGKDRELAAKDAEIDDLKGKIMSDEDLDKRVNDRADLIAVAKGIADKDYTGKSDAEIRKTAVVAVLGADAIEGKSDDYVLARFDILADDAEIDPVRKHLRHGDTAPAGDRREKAHADLVRRTEDAWKGNREDA